MLAWETRRAREIKQEKDKGGKTKNNDIEIESFLVGRVSQSREGKSRPNMNLITLGLTSSVQGDLLALRKAALILQKGNASFS